MNWVIMLLLALAPTLVSCTQSRVEGRPSESDPVGTWRVTRTWFAGTENEKRDSFDLTITRAGGQFEGRAAWPDRDASLRPRESRFKIHVADSRLSFRARQRDTEDYAGELRGDTIKGTVAVFLVAGTWEAKRVTELSPGS